jgi:ABC-type phosphate transport system permease subunit
VALGSLSRVSVVQTLLIYAAIPLCIYGLIALLTLRGKFARTPRYRPGQSWDYPAVWWTANPAGVGAQTAAVPTGGSKGAKRTAKGGARGSW